MQERLKAANKSLDSLRSQVPVDQRINELQLQVSSLQQLVEALRREKEEAIEARGELKKNLEIAEIHLREADVECQRYSIELVTSLLHSLGRKASKTFVMIILLTSSAFLIALKFGGTLES